MIGIVVPAHDEEELIGHCLATLLHAGTDPLLGGEETTIVVVLDACSDGTKYIVQQYAARTAGQRCVVECIEIEARNVGIARAAGARYVLERASRWLAFTDADSRVSPAWLSIQLNLNVDVVCGSVMVDDWSPHKEFASMLCEHFARTYNDNDGHRHIHGANLGVSAELYIKAGGFSPLACHEDVALVAALEKIGARFAWSAAPRVITSARIKARAIGGFADTLLGVVAGRRTA
ncbi:glycosyltransferase family 2 protein [Glaciimonas sp. PAMC28666]|uniref:glycosyltransferase n=1 Tax=Glaciimonas sp. PAMC28666 TaxID=2807626 RepID=UPI0019657438|nr:glycosyltransferase family 2 protein [Glaciimonas sp. PAMC28666]QRX84080.1 glycosyltransferase family 2 protein [Glaciimonas sp. PAMC28666]